MLLVSIRKRTFILVTIFSSLAAALFLMVSSILISRFSLEAGWFIATTISLSFLFLFINRAIQSQSNYVIVSKSGKEFIHIKDGFRSKGISTNRKLEVKIFGQEIFLIENRQNRIRNLEKSFFNSEYMCSVYLFEGEKIICRITGLTRDQAELLKSTLVDNINCTT
jgi:hypothetical protein